MIQATVARGGVTYKMNCPTCNAQARALETRTRGDGSKYRRYMCANGHRFSTINGEVTRIDSGKVARGRQTAQKAAHAAT